MILHNSIKGTFGLNDAAWVATTLNGIKKTYPDLYRTWLHEITKGGQGVSRDTLYQAIVAEAQKDDLEKRINMTVQRQTNTNNNTNTNNPQTKTNNTQSDITLSCGCKIKPGWVIHTKENCWVLHPEKRVVRPPRTGTRPNNNDNKTPVTTKSGAESGVNSSIYNIDFLLLGDQESLADTNELDKCGDPADEFVNEPGVLTTFEGISRDDVIVDSGASGHVFNSEKWFVYLHKHAECKGIKVANGGHLTFEGVSMVRTGVPHCPQHQGRVEKAGDTILRGARAQTIDAELPEELWPFAVKHSALLTNILPTAANDDSRSPRVKISKRL